MSAIIDLLVPDPRSMPTAAIVVLDFVLKGAVILGLAAIAVLLLRQSRAATRELVWRLAFVGVLLVPLLSIVLPEWRISILAPQTVPPAVVLAAGEGGAGRSEPQRLDPTARVDAQAAESVGGAVAAAPSAAPGSAPVRDGRALGAWIALGIWATGVFASLVPLLRSLARVRRALRGLARIEEPALLELRGRCVARLGIRRAVVLLRHDSEALPMAWCGKPWGAAIVVLPRAARGWSPERQEMVLLHEMAHIARHDCLAQLLARLVRALSWPDPLAWLALRRLRGEAEQAADERVLAAGHRGSNYADHLLEIARGKVEPAFAPAVAMAGRSSLGQRLQAILATRGIPRPLKPLTLGLAIALLLGSVTPLAMMRRDFTVRAAAALGVESLIAEPDPARDRGLARLAALQLPTGAWPGDVGHKFNDGYQVTVEGKPHVGVTALALLALVEAGHLPERGAHGAIAEKAAHYLAGRIDPETGYIRDHGSRMKSHGFALLALCRYQAEVRDAALQAKITAAVKFSARSQNETGGWRYTPEAPDADLLGTVCQVLALEAAAAAGFPVSAATLKRARAYVGRCRCPEGEGVMARDRGGFKYQDTLRSRVSPGTTGAGLAVYLMQADFDREVAGRALDRLLKELPSLEKQRPGHYLLWHALYYASEAGRRAAAADPERFAERWRDLRAHLRELLLATQKTDGGWPCSVGPGPAFSTAMGCLLLSGS